MYNLNKTSSFAKHMLTETCALPLVFTLQCKPDPNTPLVPSTFSLQSRALRDIPLPVYPVFLAELLLYCIHTMLCMKLFLFPNQ